jgi:O-antigen ligase
VGTRDLLVSESVDLFRSGGLHGLVGRGPAMTRTSLKSVQAPYANEAHNDFLAVLLERGVIGIVGLIFLVAGLAIRVARISSRGLSPGYASVVPAPGAIAGAIVALGLSSFSHEVLHFRHVWVLFGIVAALHLWGGIPDRNPVRRAAT